MTFPTLQAAYRRLRTTAQDEPYEKKEKPLPPNLIARAGKADNSAIFEEHNTVFCVTDNRIIRTLLVFDYIRLRIRNPNRFLLITVTAANPNQTHRTDNKYHCR